MPAEKNLTPFAGLFEVEMPEEAPLPAALEQLYGKLRFPSGFNSRYVYANFISTLDGVVSLGDPGFSGAEHIGGSNPNDRLLMGLLRALSDAVIAGASTLRQPPGHIWTPGHIYAPLSAAYRELRRSYSLPPHPLNVIVTASGQVNLSLPVFHTPGLPVLLLTTPAGAGVLVRQSSGQNIVALPPGKNGLLSAAAILEAVEQVAPARHILVEGGPRMMGRFLSEGLLDELFLTLSPQVAGRDQTVERPGFVSGLRFAPLSPKWGELLSLKMAGSFLFLRYAFR